MPALFCSRCVVIALPGPETGRLLDQLAVPSNRKYWALDAVDRCLEWARNLLHTDRHVEVKS